MPQVKKADPVGPTTVYPAPGRVERRRAGMFGHVTPCGTRTGSREHFSASVTPGVTPSDFWEMARKMERPRNR